MPGGELSTGRREPREPRAPPAPPPAKSSSDPCLRRRFWKARRPCFGRLLFLRGAQIRQLHLSGRLKTTFHGLQPGEILLLQDLLLGTRATHTEGPQEKLGHGAERPRFLLTFVQSAQVPSRIGARSPEGSQLFPRLLVTEDRTGPQGHMRSAHSCRRGGWSAGGITAVVQRNVSNEGPGSVLSQGKQQGAALSVLLGFRASLNGGHKARTSWGATPSPESPAPHFSKPESHQLPRPTV